MLWVTPGAIFSKWETPVCFAEKQTMKSNMRMLQSDVLQNARGYGLTTSIQRSKIDCFELMARLQVLSAKLGSRSSTATNASTSAICSKP